MSLRSRGRFYLYFLWEAVVFVYMGGMCTRKSHRTSNADRIGLRRAVVVGTEFRFIIPVIDFYYGSFNSSEPFGFFFQTVTIGPARFDRRYFIV